MATIGVEEYQFAPLSSAIYESLLKNYGISEDNAIWFMVHGEADLEHRERALEDFANYASTPELRDRILWAASRSLDAMWLWHDGIYKRYT